MEDTDEEDEEEDEVIQQGGAETQEVEQPIANEREHERLLRNYESQLNVLVAGADRFRLEDYWDTYDRQIGLQGTVFRFTPTQTVAGLSFLENFFVFAAQLVRYIRQHHAADDLVSFFINGSGVDTGYGGISVPFLKVAHLHSNVLFDEIYKVVQSNEGLVIDDGRFSIQVTLVSPPRVGGKRVSRQLLNDINLSFDDILHRCRCLLAIPSTFHPYCFFVALHAAKCLSQGQPRQRVFHYGSRYRAHRLFHRFYALAGIRVSSRFEGLNYTQFEAIARLALFRDHPICIWERGDTYGLFKKYNVRGKENPLHLFLQKDRLAVITSIRSFLGIRGFFCVACEKSSTSKKEHRCVESVCFACKTKCSLANVLQEGTVFCESCRRFFKSAECFRQHLEKGASPLYHKKQTVCLTVRRCRNCFVDLKCENGVSKNVPAYSNSTTSHKCFHFKCHYCQEYVRYKSVHHCYVQKLSPEEREEKRKPTTFWFYDIETEKVPKENGGFIFQPILVVLLEENSTVPEIFYGVDCMRRFLSRICVGPTSISVSCHGHHVFLAHNAAKFDGLFVLKAYTELKMDDPKIFVQRTQTDSNSFR